MRAGVPWGKRRSMTAFATYWGSPSVGWVCMRKPGAALRRRDNVTAVHEHAIVVALDEALHHDNAATRLADGPLIALADIFLGTQVEADATPVVTVQRFEDDRVADAGGHRGGLIGR